MTCRYRAVERDDILLRKRIKELANKHKRYGSSRIQALLRKADFIVNHKKTERIYEEENLSLKTKKKLPLKERTTMASATRSNEIWSIDFMSDSLSRGS